MRGFGALSLPILNPHPTLSLRKGEAKVILANEALSFARLLQQFSSQHANIGQIAITLPEIEPVTDYKFVFDFEPDIICIHFPGALSLFAQ